MKEHVQKPGVRKWAGEDLLELQGETLTALQALVEPYAPCIIQGCGVGQTDGVYQVQPGIVALKGSNEDGSACTKIVRFAGYTGEVLPVYLTIKVTPYMRVYADEENKPIAYEYTAEAFTNEPADIPYLKIDASGGSRLVDTIGITQKLDREGGNASNVKVVSFKEDTAAGRINISAGMTLKELFGRIYRWLRDLKALAFKDKVDISDIETTLANKLNGIEANANKYTHPSSAAGAKTSGLYKIATDANGHVTGAAAVAKSDITDLGIPAQDTVYNHPTNSGNKHIPAGGSSGQYLKYSASGTAAWATPGSNTATSSVSGFMSAADKTKLDGIAAGANAYTHPSSAAGAKTSGLYKIATDANGHVTGAAAVAKSDITALGVPAQDTVYTHPTTAGNKHIPTGGSSGQYLKYSASGTAVWNKPTASEIGAAAASHSHAAATESSAGFMSATDKSNFDKMAKCKIVGAYIIGPDYQPIIAQYGYKITNMNKYTYNGEAGYKFTLSTANGFSSSGIYMCIAVGGYQHTADLYNAWLNGGQTGYLFHRNLQGVPEYTGFPVRMFIIECF